MDTTRALCVYLEFDQHGVTCFFPRKGFKRAGLFFRTAVFKTLPLHSSIHGVFPFLLCLLSALDFCTTLRRLAFESKMATCGASLFSGI